MFCLVAVEWSAVFCFSPVFLVSGAAGWLFGWFWRWMLLLCGVFGLGDVIFAGFSLLDLGICWACFWAFGVCCVFVLLFLSSVERGVVAMSSWVRNLDGFLGLFNQF